MGKVIDRKMFTEIHHIRIVLINNLFFLISLLILKEYIFVYMQANIIIPSNYSCFSSIQVRRLGTSEISKG